MGLVQKREGIFGAVPWLLPGMYLGKGLPWPSLRCRGLGWRPGTSPWVWWGNEHVSSLTSLLISQHNVREMGTRAGQTAKLTRTPPPPFHPAAQGGKGQGMARRNRAPLMNKPFGYGFIHPQRA